jgi:1-acyl-sn-glycerol-3-phosphate acyltransferase
MRLLALGAARVLFRFGTIGSDNVPASGAALLAANHESLLDPPLVGAGTRRELDFLAKAELFPVPLFGGLIRRLNAHPVERGGTDLGALRQALALLRAGRALLVFPAGTRSAAGQLGAARPGAGMLATLSRAPVVPVHIQGSGRALARGARLPRLARVTVTYGKPLTFAPGRGKAYYQEVSDEIMAAIGRLRADVRGAGMPAPVRSAAHHADRTAQGPSPVGHSH